MVRSSARIASSSSTTRIRFSASFTRRGRAISLPSGAYAELVACLRARFRAARLTEELRHLPVEGRKVIRLAAGDPVAVADAFRVLPVRAGVAQIVLQRRPAGH